MPGPFQWHGWEASRPPHRPRQRERADHALRDAKGQSQHREIRVLIARDRVQGHGQQQGAEAAEHLQHDRRAHLRRVPGDAREFRGGPLRAGRPV